MIGQSPRRKEDERLITGRGRYVDDVALPGLQHLVVVRSVHARARLVRIDAAAARALPGASVFTAADLPELAEPLPTFVEPTSNPYAEFNTPPPQPALARDEVRHVGEAVAVVVAPDRYLAADAAAAVAVEYAPLPAVVDAEAGLADDAPRVHEGRSNVAGRVRMQIGDVERAFREADVVVEARIRYPRVTSMPIETRGVCAAFEAATGTLTIWAAHQFPFMLRDTVARLLGLRPEDVRAIAADIGGGFGPKAAIYPEDVLVPAVARRLGTPVKWIQGRSEFLLTSQHAREQVHDARLAARRDGTILGVDLRLVKDGGAYHYWALIDPTNTINHLPGQYRIENFRAEGVVVLTNKVPAAPYRGAGRPEAVFVIERLLDLLARRLDVDPAEIRRRNLVPPEAMPYRPGLTYRDGIAVTYDGGDYPLQFRRALEAADYDGWRRRQAELRKAGRRIGIGLATYLEAGGVGWPGEGATVKVNDDGSVDVFTGVSSQGQGHETVFAQVCAEFLGARFDDIRVRGGDTSLIPYGFGTGASRVAVNTGNAVAEAAEAVAAKARCVAARLLECDDRDVRIEDGRAFVAGAPMRAVPLGTLARAAIRDPGLADLGGPGLRDTKFYYPPSVTWSSGVHVAVVEVDADTGRVAILKYVMAHDCGRQLNPMIVEGQVAGGFAQGLGVALGEQLVYDDQGQLLTGTLMDYVFPRADDIPKLVIEHLHFPTTHNRLGVRGVGEGPTGPPPAALANAVADAFGGLDLCFPVLLPRYVAEALARRRAGA